MARPGCLPGRGGPGHLLSRARWERQASRAPHRVAGSVAVAAYLTMQVDFTPEDLGAERVDGATLAAQRENPDERVTPVEDEG